MLQVADPEILSVADIDLDDDGLDQDLGQNDIEFGDDIGDHFHVLARSKNQQGIHALIGDNFGLAEDLNFSADGGFSDDILKPIGEAGAGAGGSSAGDVAGGTESSLGALGTGGTGISADAAWPAKARARPSA